MNAEELSSITAVPLQKVGMAFYFDPLTGERAKESGLNIFEFYGLGRGGTLGDVHVDTVEEAFTFFHPRTINRLWTVAKTKTTSDPVTVAGRYVHAAYEYADRTFGGVDVQVLADFADAAHYVASHVEKGRHQLVDGYKKFTVPDDPVHAAYLGAILMRELRGCVHIEAVHDVGITAKEACYLEDPALFTMHGFQEDEIPVVTPELEKKKADAEVVTSAKMASCFEVLSDEQREHLADGALAMFAALSSPVAVAR